MFNNPDKEKQNLRYAYLFLAEKHAEVPCVTASVDDLHIKHNARLLFYCKFLS